MRTKFNLLNWFWWLQKILYVWVRSKCLPNSAKDLGLDPDRPVCFVLKARLISDLLVLDHHCRKLGLPRPIHNFLNLSKGSDGTYIYLVRSGIFQKKRLSTTPSAIRSLVDKVKSADQDIQLVPVSIFWGRNPGSEEKSLFKLLFLDDEHGGMLQRILTIIAHGRNVVCNFGKPVSIFQQLDDTVPSSETAKKIRRVLRIHFRKQREAILGPNIYYHPHVVKSVLNSRSVREAIDGNARRKGSSVIKSQQLARKQVEEVAAKQSHNVLRFFDIVLGWIWKKIYDGVDVYHDAELRALAEDHEIVYMPCHRSHMDYLLIGYILYSRGLMPPHTAAGVNLNFWPIGALLRRGGAFFIRRTFAGNRLYGAVFNEYVHYLLSHGYPISYYPEGGRSRTGRMLKPKVGMLSMVLQSAKRSSGKPIALVPVYIGYDRVMEARTYAKELMGKAKKSESMKQLLGARKILKTSFGKAYIGFGKPILVQDFMDGAQPAWKDRADEDGKLAKSLTPAVSSLNRAVVNHINEAAVMSPMSLFSTIILATPKHALTEDDLLACADTFLAILKKAPYSERSTLVTGDLRGKLAYAEKLSELGRFSHSSGDVIFVSEHQKSVANFYRNNSLHLFAIPSLIAAFFRHENEQRVDRLVNSCVFIYRFICEDLCLTWSEQAIGQVVRKYVNALVSLDLLVKNGNQLVRPNIIDRKFLQLRVLGGILHPEVEKYAIYGAMLSRYESKGRVQLTHFEEEARGTLKRLSILIGMEQPSGDAVAFKNFVAYMKDAGYLGSDASNVWVNKPVTAVLELIRDVLSPDIKQSLLVGDTAEDQDLPSDDTAAAPTTTPVPEGPIKVNENT